MSDRENESDKTRYFDTNAAVRLGLKLSKTNNDFLNDPEFEKYYAEYEAKSKEEKLIQDRIINKKYRQSIRKNYKSHFDLKHFFVDGEPDEADCDAYLELVTKQLEEEGLWREKPQESYESELFPIDDLRDEDVDENFEPKSLDLIYAKNVELKMVDSLKELQEQGLEWEDSIALHHLDYPQFATPTAHNLLRRPPWSLNEVVARKMFEGTFFVDHPQLENLFLCSYFMSKSIFSRIIFIQVKYEAFTFTPLQKKFRQYAYRRYVRDRKIFEKLVKETLKGYFHINFHVSTNVYEFAKNQNLSEARRATLLKSIWRKFLETEKNLTKKQRAAVNAVYTEYPPLTYAQAAAKEKTSKDSFRDRIVGAIKKFKKNLPELGDLRRPSTYLKSKKCNMVYDGLYNKTLGKIIRPLYRISVITYRRIPIPTRQGPLKRPPKVGPYDYFSIHAWAIHSSPVPDLIDTEYFCGLFPEKILLRISKLDEEDDSPTVATDQEDELYVAETTGAVFKPMHP